jgi:hypothetical protein
MDERTVAQIAINETRYRKLNEESRGSALEAPTRTFEILCECGSPDCMMLISVLPGAYRDVRANPHWFIVKPGHEIPSVETVVAKVESDLQLGSYVVVAKDKGVGRDIAEETAPR